ncbi:MAG: hypothetical protein IJ493_11280 [Clostridia bacterium]|nr:hypothetical protein [Clostridia bacterium]
MPRFKLAQPVFIKEKSREMNYTAGFVTKFNAVEGAVYTLNITGASYYRIYLNGEFQLYGPARGPHGYVRVDSIKLPVKAGENTLAIELAGYAIPSFYSIDLPSFVQAELYENDELIRYTGRDFKGVTLTSLKLQKVWRYSFQRDFTEVWDLTSPLAGWKNGDFKGEELAIVDYGCDLLDRDFKLPDLSLDNDAAYVASGVLKEIPNRQPVFNRFMNPSVHFRCFKSDELCCNPIAYLDKDYVPDTSISTVLTAGQYAQYNFGHITTGFLRTKVSVTEPTVLYVIFSERIRNERVDFGNGALSFINILKYTLPVGEHQLESYEPYSLMHAAVVVESGCAQVETVGLRRFVYPAVPVKAPTDDPMLEVVMNAAFEAFRQNTLDCFMDCPGRERGGWLCDSYFTGKAALLFTGDTEVERAFLENFRVAKYFPYIPDGLLPMCYPGDSANGSTIPQWTMWYIIELAEFGKRGGDTKPYAALLTKILNFFSKYENADGLLENLPGWNFVEWSKANNWTKDVNYPTNMLYVRVLRDCAGMLDSPELAEKADKIAVTIVKQSFDGSFFADHAVRRPDGSLERCKDYSAICQHEAALFGIIDIDAPQYAKIKDAVSNSFGFGDAGVEGIEPLDLFVGYAVRVELLLKMGLYQKNLDEIKLLYGQTMGEKTGTFWEHHHDRDSLNHGFSSFIACAVLECLNKLNG